MRETYPAKSRYQGPVAREYVARRVQGRKWEREQEIVEAYVKRLPPGSSILDAPIGTGRFLPLYVDMRIYGLDISRDMLAEARGMDSFEARGPGLLMGEVESLPLRDRSVDYVVCARLLNWVPLAVMAGMLAEFSRVARRGMLIGVRIREPQSLPRLAQALGRELFLDTGTTARRVAQRTRGRVLAMLSRVKRTVLRAPARRTAAATPDEGSVVHAAADVARIFSQAGLSVERIEVADRRTLYRRREAQTLVMYRLRCSGNA